MEPLQWTRYRRPYDEDRGVFWEWLRQLEGFSGVYEIRDAETHAILWIGESHTARLYGTITRHFQPWSSRSNVTYDRRAVEVRVMVTPPEIAQATQHVAIQEAKAAGEPLDNYQDGTSFAEVSDSAEPTEEELATILEVLSEDVPF